MASSSKNTSEGGGRGPQEETKPQTPHGKAGQSQQEDQCKKAEVLRKLGVSCKACLQGPFRHKSHDSGPDGGGVAGMSLTTAQRRDETAGGEREKAKASSEYVRFETENGLALFPNRVRWTHG